MMYAYYVCKIYVLCMYEYVHANMYVWSTSIYDGYHLSFQITIDNYGDITDKRH